MTFCAGVTLIIYLCLSKRTVWSVYLPETYYLAALTIEKYAGSINCFDDHFSCIADIFKEDKDACYKDTLHELDKYSRLSHFQSKTNCTY